MERAMVLFVWEMKRIIRSRAILVLILLAPAACGLAAATLAKGTIWRVAFLVTSLLFGWLIVGLRAYSDRLSGFLGGLESTPAAGTPLSATRLLMVLAVAAVQSVIFVLVTRLPI